MVNNVSHDRLWTDSKCCTETGIICCVLSSYTHIPHPHYSVIKQYSIWITLSVLAYLYLPQTRKDCIPKNRLFSSVLSMAGIEYPIFINWFSKFEIRIPQFLLMFSVVKIMNVEKFILLQSPNIRIEHIILNCYFWLIQKIEHIIVWLQIWVYCTTWKL